ncbi:DUF2279 domain-containing protein [Candidatus Parabeggiatoa sp. HSG14]|uniref:DUF2279 domain-containing protein n=1 Tax=Candidatus Parabeggiatoa sp. HSG14 TaxID=3055593 RepID=UPI0025A6A628|nr:DUF2279 domain-containing protein [Thiotrichales bacterium HSG14]
MSRDTQPCRDTQPHRDTRPRRDTRPCVSTLDFKQKKFRSRLLMSGFALGLAFYGKYSWWDKNSSNFRVRHEDWFAADTPNGGADKLGHTYAFYISTRLMKNGFEWAGYNRKQAVQLAGITSGVISLGVEVMDGFTEKYGFSSEDVIMNLSGISMGIILETYPQWDNLFDIRLKYWPSDDAKRLNDYDPIADYSGQTYLLITKASAIPTLRKQKFLRYLELAVGYGTKGYQPNDGTGTQSTSRHFYYGLSLNLSLLFNDTIFKIQERKSQTQIVTENILEYLQMPGTALLFEHNF